MKDIQKELQQLSNEELFDHIADCKRLRRHPYATGSDMQEYDIRISHAEEILTQRLRAAMAPEGPRAKTPEEQISEQLQLPQNRNSKIDISEDELAVRSLLLLSEKALRERLRRIHGKLRHPHVARGSEAEERLRNELHQTKEALHLKIGGETE